MSDDPGKTPEPGAPAAPEAGKQPPAGTVDDPGGRDDSGSLSPEDARKLRSEARNLRDRLKSTEDDLKKLQDGELSERQKLERDKKATEARAEQLEAKLRDRTVEVIAAKLGVKSDLADTISPLLDWSALDPEDSKAIEKAVKELVKERPSLSGRPEGLEGGVRGGRQGETDMNSIIRRRTGRV